MPFGDDEHIARAEVAMQRGLDGDCEKGLLERRRTLHASGDIAGVQRVEAMLAVWAVTIDDERRARAHLAAISAYHLRNPDVAQDAALRMACWIVSSQIARRDPSVTQPGYPSEGLVEARVDPTTKVEMLLEVAAVARARDEITRAWGFLDAAIVVAEGAPRLLARVQQEVAETLLANAKINEAEASLREAIRMYKAQGLARFEGRALLRFAQAVAPIVPGTEPPAVWFSRAQAALATCSTWRDRAAIRAGFRVHGRRLPDLAVAEGMSLRIDALDRACALLRGAVASSADSANRIIERVDSSRDQDPSTDRVTLAQAEQALREIPGAAAPLIDDVERTSRELVEMMSSALVERDRMQSLLRALGELDGVTEVHRYATEVTTSARAILDADLVVLASLDERGELQMLASRTLSGTPVEINEDLWRHASMARLKVPSTAPPNTLAPSLRSETRPKGPVLVMPIRSSRFTGVIYADKLQRSGQFRESDVHLASLLAEYLAQGVARVIAAEAEHLARAQLGATLDAIRDGVLTLDARGTVRHVNAAAARMLRTSEEGLIGQLLEDAPNLAALGATLTNSARTDGAVVRLPHGTLVVTARPIAGSTPNAPQQGTVATLVELDRAQRLAARVTAARPRYGFHDVVGSSPALQEALRLARQAATVDANVLITGESGTGKEVLAQAVHTGGARAGEPFVGINCAALPRELLEAELFGYERGAFTGARSEGSIGKFEQAGDGTILLDEIGDMPLDMQVKLLRVLQERTVTRLGGSQERPFSARVVATTHRNLEESVRKGTFRLDLFYRLRVLHIDLPPLRERNDDVAALAHHFLRRVAESQNKPVRSFAPDVLKRLTSYPWPGNVRELANVIEREVSLLPASATILARFEVPLGGSSGVGDSWAPETPTSGKMKAVRVTGEASLLPTDILPLTEVERRAYLDAYAAFGGNVTRASKALGVSKVTFYAKLRQWGMHPSDEPGPETLRKIKIAERAEDGGDE